MNKDHNHDLKGLFKGAATMASVRPGPFQDFYQASLAKGIKPTMARLTLEFSNKELSMATALIKGYEEECDPTQFKDLYQERIRKLIDADSFAAI